MSPTIIQAKKILSYTDACNARRRRGSTGTGSDENVQLIIKSPCPRCHLVLRRSVLNRRPLLPNEGPPVALLNQIGGAANLNALLGR